MNHSHHPTKLVLTIGILGAMLAACGGTKGGTGNHNNANDAVCGDGIAEGNEYCDGDDLKGLDCAGLGLSAGVVACTAECVFDVSGCTGVASCGNGIREYPEACDATDLAGATCASLGHGGGVLGCTAACELDDAGCTGSAVCGDGVVQAGEVCDGSALGGASCLSQGYYGGDLACATDCGGYDLSGCAGSCGDGVVDAGEGEACDDGGANSDVTPNACRTDCQLPACGDGVVDDASGEACDDGNLVEGDGCTATCQIQLPPTCTIVAPADGAMLPFDETWTFTATAEDPEDGALSGASVWWSSDVLGDLGQGLSVSLVLDPPYTHVITCTATDSGGLTGTDSITVNAFSPVVEIWHPGDGETRQDCPVNIPFVGVAQDYEDGDLTASLQWSSDLDGPFGPGGGNFNACLSGQGANTVTASVTDSDANYASMAITLNITP